MMLMKRKATVIGVITILALLVVAWFIQNHISQLQNQIDELKVQNSEFQDQLSELQNQLCKLQLQNREQKDRLSDFTYQLALGRHLRVKITGFSWIGDFNPVAGLAIDRSVNVTVQNNDVVPLSGLTLAVRLVNEDTGKQIGTQGKTSIDRLNVGEAREISSWVITAVSDDLNDAVCVTMLKVGGIVLDEWTEAIG
jgi:hypothetical protein